MAKTISTESVKSTAWKLWNGMWNKLAELVDDEDDNTRVHLGRACGPQHTMELPRRK